VRRRPLFQSPPLTESIGQHQIMEKTTVIPPFLGTGIGRLSIVKLIFADSARKGLCSQRSGLLIRLGEHQGAIRNSRLCRLNPFPCFLFPVANFRNRRIKPFFCPPRSRWRSLPPSSRLVFTPATVFRDIHRRSIE